MPLAFYLNWFDDPVLGAETWFLAIKRLVHQGMCHLPLKEVSAQTYCYLHLWIETFCLTSKKYALVDLKLPRIRSNTCTCLQGEDKQRYQFPLLPSDSGEVSHGMLLFLLLPWKARWRRGQTYLPFTLLGDVRKPASCAGAQSMQKQSFSPSCSKCGA